MTSLEKIKGCGASAAWTQLWHWIYICCMKSHILFSALAAVQLPLPQQSEVVYCLYCCSGKWWMCRHSYSLVTSLFSLSPSCTYTWHQHHYICFHCSPLQALAYIENTGQSSSVQLSFCKSAPNKNMWRKVLGNGVMGSYSSVGSSPGFGQ